MVEWWAVVYTPAPKTKTPKTEHGPSLFPLPPRKKKFCSVPPLRKIRIPARVTDAARAAMPYTELYTDVDFNAGEDLELPDLSIFPSALRAGPYRGCTTLRCSDSLYRSRQSEAFDVWWTSPAQQVARLRAVGLMVIWRDQGWGNRKGRLRLELVRGDAVVASFMDLGDAEHVSTRRILLADAGEEIVSMYRPGDKFRCSYKVGGGGGHSLIVQDMQVTLFHPSDWKCMRPLFTVRELFRLQRAQIRVGVPRRLQDNVERMEEAIAHARSDHAVAVGGSMESKEASRLALTERVILAARRIASEWDGDAADLVTRNALPYFFNLPNDAFYIVCEFLFTGEELVTVMNP